MGLCLEQQQATKLRIHHQAASAASQQKCEVCADDYAISHAWLCMLLRMQYEASI